MNLSDVRQNLQQRLRKLENRVAKIEGDLRKPGNPDWQEKATESENDEVLERLGETETREVEEIRRALARIESGDYGTCAQCGEGIGEGRLEALPYASLCIACAD